MSSVLTKLTGWPRRSRISAESETVPTRDNVFFVPGVPFRVSPFAGAYEFPDDREKARKQLLKRLPPCLEPP